MARRRRAGRAHRGVRLDAAAARRAGSHRLAQLLGDAPLGPAVRARINALAYRPAALLEPELGRPGRRSSSAQLVQGVVNAGVRLLHVAVDARRGRAADRHARPDARALARHARVIERGPRSRRVTRKALPSRCSVALSPAAGLVVLVIGVRRPRRGSSALWGLFFAVVAAVATAGERFTRPDAQAVRMTTVNAEPAFVFPTRARCCGRHRSCSRPPASRSGPRHTAWRRMERGGQGGHRRTSSFPSAASSAPTSS